MCVVNSVFINYYERAHLEDNLGSNCGESSSLLMSPFVKTTELYQDISSKKNATSKVISRIFN